ncbi:hypothetical protein PMAYCL1PPCAC_25701, partial [Pristionchus mayeri]
LHVVYHQTTVTDRIVPRILKLAVQFQMEFIMNQAEKYLITSTGFNEVQKLGLADQCRLDSLKDHAIKSFSSLDDLNKKLKGTLEYKNYSK